MAGGDDPHVQIVAKMVAVQLLASCFTLPQYTDNLTPCASGYGKDLEVDDNDTTKILISSLRQHTQWRRSPAYGHHARNNSVASQQPDHESELSREDHLAQQASYTQSAGRRKTRYIKKSNKRRLRYRGAGEDKTLRFLHLRHLLNLDKSKRGICSQQGDSLSAFY